MSELFKESHFEKNTSGFLLFAIILYIMNFAFQLLIDKRPEWFDGFIFENMFSEYIYNHSIIKDVHVVKIKRTKSVGHLPLNSCEEDSKSLGNVSYVEDTGYSYLLSYIVPFLFFIYVCMFLNNNLTKSIVGYTIMSVFFGIFINIIFGNMVVFGVKRIIFHFYTMIYLMLFICVFSVFDDAIIYLIILYLCAYFLFLMNKKQDISNVVFAGIVGGISFFLLLFSNWIRLAKFVSVSQSQYMPSVIGEFNFLNGRINQKMSDDEYRFLIEANGKIILKFNKTDTGKVVGKLDNGIMYLFKTPSVLYDVVYDYNMNPNFINIRIVNQPSKYMIGNIRYVVVS